VPTKQFIVNIVLYSYDVFLNLFSSLRAFFNIHRPNDVKTHNVYITK